MNVDGHKQPNLKKSIVDYSYVSNKDEKTSQENWSEFNTGIQISPLSEIEGDDFQIEETGGRRKTHASRPSECDS